MNEGETLTIVLNATDPDEEDALIFSSNVSFGAFISDENTTFWSWTPDYDDARVYYVEFMVSDGELYDNETAKIVVNDVNRPPILERIGDITVMENETVLIDVNATDSDGDTLTYYCNRTDLFEFNPTTGEGVWKTDYNDAGIYYIDLGVSDGALCDNETVKITVINVNRAPVLEQIGEKTIYENQTIFIELKANDPDGDTLTFSCNRTDLFADFNKTIGKGSWTPSYDDAGIYYVDFGVSDGELCDNETVKITVKDVSIYIGDVTWDIRRSVTIGSPLTITATAPYEIKNESYKNVSVTAELLVDYICLNKNKITIKKQKGNISVSATWIPMSSGMHDISLRIYNESYWLSYENTTKVEVFIEKVEQ